jgi:hypothetical protein
MAEQADQPDTCEEHGCALQDYDFGDIDNPGNTWTERRCPVCMERTWYDIEPRLWGWLPYTWPPGRQEGRESS